MVRLMVAWSFQTIYEQVFHIAVTEYPKNISRKKSGAWTGPPDPVATTELMLLSSSLSAEPGWRTAQVPA